LVESVGVEGEREESMVLERESEGVSWCGGESRRTEAVVDEVTVAEVVEEEEEGEGMRELGMSPR